MTLDGRVATRTGQSRWITSEKARRWAHRHLRGRVDAIVVGAGTVRVDDPELTNRSGHGGQPSRVVICGRRRIPAKSKLLRDGDTQEFLSTQVILKLIHAEMCVHVL